MKKLSLNEIKSGALIGKPQQVTVQIKVDGEDCEFDTHIKPFSYATVVARWKAVGENKEALAGTIASCVCNEEGRLLFTEDQVRETFSEELIEAIWQKIYDINNIGGKSKAKSFEKTNSLQNSPSTESAGTPLKPSKKTSASKKSATGENTATDAEALTPVAE